MNLRADLAIEDAETANSYSSEKLIPYIKSEPRSTIVHYDQIIRTILRLSHVQRPKILDFGCGAGMFVRRCLKAGLDAQGIDKSPYVEEARKAFRLPLHSCDLLEGPFSKGQFDVIFSHATFEHLYDPVTIGHSLTNMLKPGGHLIFTAIPNFNTVSIRVFKNFFANTPPGHINFFESATLFDFFSRLGMQEIKVSTYGVDVWYFIHQMKRALARKGAGAQKSRSTSTMLRLAWEEELDQLNSTLDQINPNFVSRTIAHIYSTVRLPNMGVSLFGIAQKSD